jgi:uncharacterized membrane protein (Fun14 family)
MQASEIELLTKTADLLVKYGFLGVGLVLTFLAAPAIYKLWKARYPAIGVALFGIAFMAAFGVLDIVQKYFPSLIASKRVFLTGTVLGLPNGYQVQVSSDSRRAGVAFLKREIDPQVGTLNNFPFLLVSSQPPGCLSVAINNNDPNSEAGSSAFHIAPISEKDFQANADLVAKAEAADKKFKLRVWREANERQLGDAAILLPLKDTEPGCAIGKTQTLLDWLLPSAFAQDGKTPDIAVRLKSDDFLTRRGARIELSQQGPQTVDTAKKFLNSNDYRLQLGALVALSIMPPREQGQLPPDVMQKVKEFESHPDSTIRETATRVGTGAR